MENIAGAERVTIYRFRRTDGGRDICPRYMWGTREAIAALDGCVVLEDTSRQVAASELEGGFFYDIPESVSIKIDTLPAQD